MWLLNSKQLTIAQSELMYNQEVINIILIIIAKIGFRDEEFQIPFEYFKNKGIGVDVASTEKGECIGKFGGKAIANKSFEEVDINNYSGIVLIGGPGSKELVGNRLLEGIIHKAVENDLIIGAICYAPVILAVAGVLKGKKATVWNGDNRQSPVLEKHGVKFVDNTVVVDGRLVTGNGPNAAKGFAEEIAKLL